MNEHQCENYETFEAWFLDNMDRDSSATLREWGASAGVGGLVNYADIWALFSRFGGEIENLSAEVWTMELWEIAESKKVERMAELITVLVHTAAEQLAHFHKFDDDDTEFFSPDDESPCDQENTHG